MSGVSSAEWNRIRALWPTFTAAGAASGLPPALLAAVASRETRVQNIVGDGGHGHGLMQIDDRYHAIAQTPAVMDPGQNVTYGAKLLAGNLATAKANGLSESAALRAAVAGYNAGASRCVSAAKRGADPDAYTTGNDYSADVLGRYSEIAAVMGDEKKKLTVGPLLLMAASVL